MEEKIQKPGLMMVMKRPSCASSAGCWVVLFARRPVLALAGGAAAGGHAGDTPGWPGYRNAGRFLRLASSRCQRHPLKSITPQKDGLLIKFDSTAQGAAAKEVLGRALPHGYIIALLGTITRPPPGYPRYATRRIASGKLPPDCVFSSLVVSPHCYYA